MSRLFSRAIALAVTWILWSDVMKCALGWMRTDLVGRRYTTTLRSMICFPSSPRHVSSSRLFGTSSKNLWSIEECLALQGKIQFIDGSWYHKGNRNGRDEFLAGPRLPGAHYWDMDDIATSKELFPDENPKGLRVMFPTKSLIGATLRAMNITIPDASHGVNVVAEEGSPTTTATTTTTILMVYGRKGCWFTPRTWYVLKRYFESMQDATKEEEETVQVGLLQGSLEDWVQAGGAVDDKRLENYNLWAKDLVTDEMRSIAGSDKLESLVSMNDMLDQVQLMPTEESTNTPNSKATVSTSVIVDTRGSSSFSKGHIPGAQHIPYASLVENENSLRFLAKEDLQDILNKESIPKSERIWLSCGSGVSVCHMALALEECGYPAPYIYDGSWNEWGADPKTPKMTTTTSTTVAER